MRTIALLFALSAAACASNDGFVANRVETCQPGSEIEIQAGLAEQELQPGGRFTALVEVANNSDRDFTVTAVRLDPAARQDDSRYQIEGATRDFDHEIAEGESYTFEIPLTVRVTHPLQRIPRGTTVGVEAAVTVTLADGKTARCRFLLPARL